MMSFYLNYDGRSWFSFVNKKKYVNCGASNSFDNY